MKKETGFTGSFDFSEWDIEPEPSDVARVENIFRARVLDESSESLEKALSDITKKTMARYLNVSFCERGDYFLDLNRGGASFELMVDPFDQKKNPRWFVSYDDLADNIFPETEARNVADALRTVAAKFEDNAEPDEEPQFTEPARTSQKPAKSLKNGGS